jgi:hypothetical protein
MKNKILNYNSWGDIQEGNKGFDKIANWMSKNFGGSVSKLDSLISDMRTSENLYVDEWEDITTDIDSLEIERSQTKNDPAEIKRIERIIERKKSLMSALDKKHEKDLEVFKGKASEIFGKNIRLKDYWNTEMIRVESEIAEDIYNKTKELSSGLESDKLYKKYKDSMERSRDKDIEFKKKYGSFITARSNSNVSQFSLDPYINMDLKSFEAKVKGMDKLEIVKIVNYLRRERNERYATMDTEKASLESANTSPDKIKAMTESYMKQIRDLRTKITISKRYEK